MYITICFTFEYMCFQPTFLQLSLKLPVKVATDDKIEYKGRLWSLSAFTSEFLPTKLQNTSGAYQGPKYFSYGNKRLSDLRKEIEKAK